MTSQVNDLKFAALRAQGYLGAIDDMEREWGLANNLPDGTSGVPWYNALIAAGYTGALNDMAHQFWVDGGTFVPPTGPPTAITNFAASDDRDGDIRMTWSNATGELPITYDLLEAGLVIQAGVTSPYIFVTPNGTTGLYSVNAINAVATTQSNEDSGTALAPAVPELGLTTAITDATGLETILTFDGTPDGNPVSVQLFVGGVQITISGAVITGDTLVITNEQVFVGDVVTVTLDGTGTNLPDLTTAAVTNNSAITVPDAPSLITDFNATDVEVDQITMTWTNATGAGTVRHDLYEDGVLKRSNVSSPYLLIAFGARTRTYSINAVDTNGQTLSNTEEGTSVAGTPANQIGFVKYGEAHPDLLFIEPCTVQANLEANPAWGTIDSQGTGTQTFDPVRGMLVGADGGYQFNALVGHTATEFGWQFSCEVQREWLAQATTGGGDPIASNQKILAQIFGGGGTLGLMLTSKSFSSTSFGGSTDFAYGRFGAPSANPLNPTVSALNVEGGSEFIKVNVAFIPPLNGGTLIMAVDERIITAGLTTLASYGAQWETIQIVSNCMPDHYIRNIQLVASTPTFPVTNSLDNLLFFGDSITGTSGSVTEEYFLMQDPGYQDEFIYSTERELIKDDTYMGRFWGSTWGGYVVNRDGAPGLFDEVAGALAAATPDVVVLCAGTNDAGENGGVPSVNFKTDYRAMVDLLMADPNVTRVVCRNIPSRTANPVFNNPTDIAGVNSVNADISAVVTEWRTDNPNEASNLKFADIFDAFGGEQADPALFDFEDVHPNNAGNLVMGPIVAAEINAFF